MGWICAPGDLYGAVGSPLRLARTVVVGRRRELVQRVLHVLTYFIRCSDLQENVMRHAGQCADPPAGGPTLTTTLERGEVERSEYVVVSLRDEPGKPTEVEAPPPLGAAPCSDPRRMDGEGALGGLTQQSPDLQGPGSVCMPQQSPLLSRVQFRIGSADSTDSDLESRQREMDQSYRQYRENLEKSSAARPTGGDLQEPPSDCQAQAGPSEHLVPTPELEPSRETPPLNPESSASRLQGAAARLGPGRLAPYGSVGRKLPVRLLGDIRRNESSDSALGDSDEEEASSDQTGTRRGTEAHRGPREEQELPLPRYLPHV